MNQFIEKHREKLESLNLLSNLLFKYLLIMLILATIVQSSVCSYYLLTLAPHNQEKGLETPVISLELDSSEKESKFEAINLESNLPADEKTRIQYIERFHDVAISEMIKYKIPASITLAQGLLESNAGLSKLAKKGNNHFGIKCFSKKCTKGHCMNLTDDSHKDFFLIYEGAWYSYRAHSEFLQKDRYKHLQKHGKDYKKWAKGLKKAGYATAKDYDKSLISIIQRYKLNQYDK